MCRQANFLPQDCQPKSVVFGRLTPLRGTSAFRLMFTDFCGNQ
jgi:hypothetical protein